MKILLVTLLILAPLVAEADCVYEGKSYPTGTVINGFTCQVDGTWR